MCTYEDVWYVESRRTGTGWEHYFYEVDESGIPERMVGVIPDQAHTDDGAAHYIMDGLRIEFLNTFLPSEPFHCSNCSYTFTSWEDVMEHFFDPDDGEFQPAWG